MPNAIDIRTFECVQWRRQGVCNEMQWNSISFLISWMFFIIIQNVWLNYLNCFHKSDWKRNEANIFFLQLFISNENRTIHFIWKKAIERNAPIEWHVGHRHLGNGLKKCILSNCIENPTKQLFYFAFGRMQGDEIESKSIGFFDIFNSSLQKWGECLNWFAFVCECQNDVEK